MRIDQYYDEIDKSSYYLGMISQVYRDNVYVQVENLSLLNHRINRLDNLIPNTINYYVVIDGIRGTFIGQIYQSKVNSSDMVNNLLSLGEKEKVFPEAAVDILGFLRKEKFMLPGFKTVGIADRVYIANEELVNIYISSLEINEYFTESQDGQREYQKNIDNFAEISNFENTFLSVKPNTLFDRHLMSIGTTNSGKSTSSLGILDKLFQSNKKFVIIDPTGEYNDSFSNEEVTKKTLGKDTFLSTDSLDDEFWIDFFNVSSQDDSVKASVLIDAINSLRYQESQGKKEPLIKEGQKVSELLPKINEVTSKSFDLHLLPEQIKYEAVKQVPLKGEYKFKNDGNLYNASIWLIKKISYFLKSSFIVNFFSAESNDDLFNVLSSFLDKRNKKCLYINTSLISSDDSSGTTIIDLISSYLLDKKPKNESSFVLFIDEVHRYVNHLSDSSGLVTIAREGRKNGIFLFLTTQSPKDVPGILLGQVGTMIIHRLTHPIELKSIENLLESKSLSQIKKLNQGEAIITSINLLHDIQVSFKKSDRDHSNKTPLL